jgi:outer membrane protein TolC
MIACTLLAAMPRGAHAERPEESAATVAALLQVWLHRSPEVQALRAQLGAARFDVVTATLWPNPQLALNTSIVVAGRDHPPDGIYNWGPQLNIPLPILGQLAAREREARAALSVTEMSVVQTLWSRATDIAEAALERAFADAQQGELQHNLDELARIDRIVRARAAAGANPQYDVLRVGTTEATFRASLAAAQLKREQADAQLAALLAVPNFVLPEITRAGLDQFAGPGQESALVALALARRPDLLLARRGLTAARASVARFRRDVWPVPALQLGGYVTHEYPSLSLQAGLAFNLPIFDRNQGSIGRAESEASGQRATASALEARIRAEVHGAWRSRLGAQRALEAFEQTGVDTTRELIERAEVSYRAGGDFSILDLLDAYRAVWESRAQKLELERAFADADVELERVVATVGPAELARTALRR